MHDPSRELLGLNSLPDTQTDWQQCLREAYREPLALLADLQLSPDQLDWCLPASGEFPMRVPRGFARRMQAGNPHDPLLLQVLPRQIENQTNPGFVDDPLQEARFQAVPGLIHKYQGRALIITTAACGVHCRYCFRRAFPYSQSRAGQDGWRAAVDAISQDDSIIEAILSGGDPLSLSDLKLGRLLQQLANIPHLRRLRIHTRQPIVLPERITPKLLELLRDNRLRCVMVLHANHAQELDETVRNACQKLNQAGLTLLNQSVLLAGINDQPEALQQLSERLFELQVLPYYLHQLDPVSGAAHFQVADQRARGIMRSLNKLLPGYLVPRLVREIPGESGKLPIDWGHA